ncbi:MAG: HindVP family restriction endonuclease, partial [Candidatus Marithrix sp.]
MINKPRLFGINNSNRDFTKKESWGKNQFNSSFPTSLALYMENRGYKNIYITLNKDLQIKHKTIFTKELFKINVTTYHSYETTIVGENNLRKEVKTLWPCFRTVK